MNKLIPISAGIITASLIGVAVVAMQPQEQAKPITHQVAAVTTPSMPPVVTEQPAAAPVAPTETLPVQAPAPAPIEQPAAPTYKWANEMTAAGISEANYGDVTAMLLDDNGWTGGNGFTWQAANRVRTMTLIEKLTYANQWVGSYVGGWTEAHALVNKAGNF